MMMLKIQWGNLLIKLDKIFLQGVFHKPGDNKKKTCLAMVLLKVNFLLQQT